MLNPKIKINRYSVDNLGKKLSTDFLDEANPFVNLSLTEKKKFNSTESDTYELGDCCVNFFKEVYFTPNQDGRLPFSHKYKTAVYLQKDEHILTGITFIFKEKPEIIQGNYKKLVDLFNDKFKSNIQKTTSNLSVWDDKESGITCELVESNKVLIFHWCFNDRVRLQLDCLLYHLWDGDAVALNRSDRQITINVNNIEGDKPNSWLGRGQERIKKYMNISSFFQKIKSGVKVILGTIIIIIFILSGWCITVIFYPDEWFAEIPKMILEIIGLKL
jgi:hypothetical protein